MSFCPECACLLRSEFVPHHGDYFICRCGYTEQCYPACQKTCLSYLWCAECGGCNNYELKDNKLEWQDNTSKLRSRTRFVGMGTPMTATEVGQRWRAFYGTPPPPPPDIHDCTWDW